MLKSNRMKILTLTPLIKILHKSRPPGIEIGDGGVPEVLALALLLALEVDRQHDGDGDPGDDGHDDHDVPLERQVLHSVRAALTQDVVIAGRGDETGVKHSTVYTVLS